MVLSESAWKAAAARLFDDRAEMWRGQGVPEGARLARVTDRLGRGPGALVLDAGCGSANWTAALAQAGYRVRGVDLSPGMIAQGQLLLRELGLDAELASAEVGDVERLPFPAATFDAIVSFRVLDYAPRPGAALAEFQRVLKPGGRLVLAVLGALAPIKSEWWERFLPSYAGEPIGNNLLPWEMEKLLAATGWEVVEQFGEYQAMAGTDNPFAAIAERLPHDRLRQAAASSWWFVARKPA